MNSSPNPNLGKEVHITSAKQLRSRVRGNLQARFCRRVWGSDSSLDSTKLHPTLRHITFSDKKGIGEVKLLGKWDIHTYPVKSIKRVRLVRRADGYYCQFAIDVERQEIQPKTGNVIGLDVGLETFYTDSNGHTQPNPRFLAKAEKAIKHAQRRIYKKEKGKNNRRKARRRYAKKHLKVTRQRTEHAKRLARHVVKSNDLIAVR
ncbi:transposase [Microseira wollei NIES-4236]|uniref:Transposase n=1 Tax=Microseira wollei NIES-4236 TaxID=2530354 RepID=A0AAV3XLY6_9CYAN|nr:transposase [Microseira wollei]GET43952.1 transposase [Microseira wollei NIES-4236]